MDRRSFLRTTGAAAAATAAGGAALAEETAIATSARCEPAAPAILTGTIELRLAMPWPDETTGFGDQALRLARRIAAATGNRVRIAAVSAGTDGIAAIAAGTADLYHGSENHHLDHHASLAYFAGLPCGTGLEPEGLEAWLTVGGGQELWDDLAAGFGVKALLAGHTGAKPGLWSVKPIDGLADLTGRRVAVGGLAREVMRGIGAEPVDVLPGALAAALANGEIDAAEWGGALQSLAAGLPRAARFVGGDGINSAGTALSLGIRRSLWESLGAADRAVIEACAATEARISLNEARAHERTIRRMLADAWGVRFAPLPADVTRALSRVAEAVVAHAAGGDAVARHIDGSYMAFRTALDGAPGEVATVA